MAIKFPFLRGHEKRPLTTKKGPLEKLGSSLGIRRNMWCAMYLLGSSLVIRAYIIFVGFTSTVGA